MPGLYFPSLQQHRGFKQLDLRLNWVTGIDESVAAKSKGIS